MEISIEKMRKKIQKLWHDVYTENLTDEEKNKIYEQINELKELRDKLVEDDILNIELDEETINRLNLDVEDEIKRTKKKKTQEPRKIQQQRRAVEIEENLDFENYTLSEKTVNSIVSDVESEVDGIYGYATYDDIDSSIDREDEYEKLLKNFVEKHNLEDLDDDVDLADEWYNNQYRAMEEQITSELYKKGISYRDGKYDRIELAQKGYDELLDFLDKNNIKYETSRSWNAGDLPSIYLKNEEEDVILRIANHENNTIDDYVYNSAYDTIFKPIDYVNWKERILPKINKELEKFNLEELICE